MAAADDHEPRKHCVLPTRRREHRLAPIEGAADGRRCFPEKHSTCCGVHATSSGAMTSLAHRMLWDSQVVRSMDHKETLDSSANNTR